MDNWFSKDWVLRGISILLAAILWFMVSEPTLPFSVNRASTTVKGIEVEYHYDTHKYQLMSEKHKVDLMFTGDKNTVNRLPAYRVYVDLNKVPAGKYTALPIIVEGLPTNVQVSVTPATIPVEIAEKVTKTLPITLITRGAVAYGYKLLPFTYGPATVRVSGIKQEVEKVSSITGLVNVNKLKQTVKREISLSVHSKTAHKPKVSITPNETQVTIPVEKKEIPTLPEEPDQLAYRDLPLKITISKPPPDGYKVQSITTNPPMIRVYGSIEKLRNLQSYPGGAIDLSQVTSDTTFTQQVKVVTPAEKVAPTKVEIYVKMIRTPT
ncbi:CdaR family protein [Shimazuella kribbensis]|uniref:CdaR family protein n=1 Tax=Shimazuella kribbensis TaxID=139808 RepID=UPI00040EE659|nr:CdaR family protein [Shimazuella kribbensis]